MFGWLRKAAKKALLCRHKGETGLGTIPDNMHPMTDYTVVRTETLGVTLGVTLGWTCRPQVMTRALCHCLLCGEDWWARPGYMPRSLDWSERDVDDWPLNADGSRMKTAGTRPLKEGYTAKGGLNAGQSQVKVRPPAPAPMTR